MSSTKEKMPEAKPGDPMLKAVIYPDDKKIGCVLLQAMYGGDSSVPSLFFDNDLWALSPMKNPRPCSATAEQWRWLAKKWAGTLVVVLALTTILTGCAELDEPAGPTLRACDVCYYHNNTYTYHSLFFDDGRVVLVEPWSKFDIEGQGHFIVRTGPKRKL